jgi:hypothetical protein
MPPVLGDIPSYPNGEAETQREPREVSVSWKPAPLFIDFLERLSGK